jgi:hypothetical protein
MLAGRLYAPIAGAIFIPVGASDMNDALHSCRYAGLFCGLLLFSLAGCSNDRPVRVVTMQHNGLWVEAKLLYRKPGAVRILGTVKAVNLTSQRNKFDPLQLFVRTSADRYRTQRFFPLEMFRDNSPLELAPGDSTTIKVFWFTGASFDTTGLQLEYSDFSSAGRVRTQSEQLGISREDLPKKAAGPGY